MSDAENTPKDEAQVFAFLDYRAFLAAHFAAVKARRPRYSYRAFARAAEAKSPNYLKLVIDGRRNLSENMAERFGRACGLQGEALEYFLDLVRFNQATGSGERERAYKRLSSLRGYQEVHPLAQAISEYHQAWYIPAIRELCARSDAKADPRWLANTLMPRISEKEAKRALTILLRLGLVEEENGKLLRRDLQVSTGPQTHSVHLNRFHREMLSRAGDALARLGPKERDLSSVTLCMGPEGLAKLRKATQDYRRQLLALEQLEEDPRQVFQVNIQLFPLSQPEPSEEQS